MIDDEDYDELDNISINSYFNDSTTKDPIKESLKIDENSQENKDSNNKVTTISNAIELVNPTDEVLEEWEIKLKKIDPIDPIDKSIEKRRSSTSKQITKIIEKNHEVDDDMTIISSNKKITDKSIINKNNTVRFSMINPIFNTVSTKINLSNNNKSEIIELIDLMKLTINTKHDSNDVIVDTQGKFYQLLHTISFEKTSIEVFSGSENDSKTILSNDNSITIRLIILIVLCDLISNINVNGKYSSIPIDVLTTAYNLIKMTFIGSNVILSNEINAYTIDETTSTNNSNTNTPIINRNSILKSPPKKLKLPPSDVSNKSSSLVTPLTTCDNIQNEKEIKENKEIDYFLNSRLSLNRSSLLFNFGQFYENYVSKIKKDIYKKKIFQEKLNKAFPYKTKVVVKRKQVETINTYPHIITFVKGKLQ